MKISCKTKHEIGETFYEIRISTPHVTITKLKINNIIFDVEMNRAYYNVGGSPLYYDELIDDSDNIAHNKEELKEKLNKIFFKDENT